ncbi:hypothetical protein QZH41_009122 [Actinostola sp. cb2023]|nr:hypothetical protein QZH41_009122 [Actinostola sp. cb2023]
MTNNDKELDREAERALKSLTTAPVDQNGFDQEFDVAFDHSFDRSIDNFHHKTAKINHEIIQESVVLTQQKADQSTGVPTSLPSSPGSLSTSSSSEIPQPPPNDAETHHDKVCNERAPQKHRGRKHTQKSSLPPGIRKLPSPPTNLEQAQMEWDMVETVQPGLDPATDLRGCGLLGLLNLLYLVTDDRLHSLALDIYKLSQHETQNFPFCIMSINITRIALQALREEKLNKECNKRRSVISAFCDFYVAIFYHIYQIWKHQHKTISDSGFVLKEGEKFALKKTVLALKQFEQALIDRKNLVIPEEENLSPKSKEIAVMDKFSGVCDLPSHEEEEVHLV